MLSIGGKLRIGMFQPRGERRERSHDLAEIGVQKRCYTADERIFGVWF
jgi:hypothetical protein